MLYEDVSDLLPSRSVESPNGVRALEPIVVPKLVGLPLYMRLKGGGKTPSFPSTTAPSIFTGNDCERDMEGRIGSS